MQTVALRSVSLARPATRAVAARRTGTGLRAARLVVRAAEEPKEEAAAQKEQEAPSSNFNFPSSGAPVAAVAAADNFSILGVQQEIINSRAAMIGFFVAIATELSTGQSVWSQIAGKYVDTYQTEKPIAFSTLSFGFVVVVLALASFAPMVYKNEGPDARSLGPFTPKAEISNGRAAMMGFLALLAVEFFRGNVALF